MDSMITIKGVTKRYGNTVALSNLTLEVEKGKFFGYLGPNGSGKTTTIKCLMGLVHPDEGTIIVNGMDVSKDPLGVRSIIGFVPDSPFMYGKLTGREFLRFVGGLFRMEKKDMEKRIDWLTDVFDMKNWLNLKTEEYSHGMKQKVIMSSAFLHRPQLLVVDEPMIGLDPPSARLVKDMLKMIQEHGTTIFMSSHDLANVEELCERMAIIYRGTVVAEGTLDDLKKKAEMDGVNLESLFMKLTNYESKVAYME